MGNIKKRSSKSDTSNYINFIHNSQNQLVGGEVVVGNNSVKKVYFSYDPLGNRIKKEVVDKSNPIKSYVKYYVNDGTNVLGEIDAQGNKLLSYTNALGATDFILSISVENSSLGAIGEYYVTRDKIGSIIDIVNGEGKIIQHNIYSAYGKRIGILDVNDDPVLDAVIKTDKGYTSREFDSEISLQYNRARYYDPTIGSFVEKDPYEGSLTSPLSFLISIVMLGITH